MNPLAVNDNEKDKSLKSNSSIAKKSEEEAHEEDEHVRKTYFYNINSKDIIKIISLTWAK